MFECLNANSTGCRERLTPSLETNNFTNKYTILPKIMYYFLQTVFDMVIFDYFIKLNNSI